MTLRSSVVAHPLRIGLKLSQQVHSIETPAGPVKAVVTMSLQFLLGQPKRRNDALEDLNLLMEELKS